MKKTLVALAALASTAAFAQSVTMYGILDLSIGAFDAKRAGAPEATTAALGSKAGLQMMSGVVNGSRLGVRGDEDLGGGVKGVFTIEAGIAADDPAATTWGGRQTFVGLTGGFGSLTMGRQYTRLDTMVCTYDAQGCTGLSGGAALFGVAKARGAYNTRQSNGAGAAGAAAAAAPLETPGAGNLGDSARWSNSVLYSLPAMGPVSASLMYKFGEDGTAAASSGSGYGLLAGFASGPLSAHVLFESEKQSAGNATRSTAVGGAYDLGVVKLLAQYLMQDDGEAAATIRKENGYNVGLVAPVGPATIHVSYSRDTLKTGGASAGKATGIGAEVRYNLSKRTFAYAGARSMENTGTAVKAERYALGIRHSF